MTGQHDPLEEGLRAALRGPAQSDLDSDAFLAEVHRGARRRRTRRAAGATATAVAVLAAGGFAVSATGILDDDTTPIADETTGTPASESDTAPLLTDEPTLRPTSPLESPTTLVGVDPATIVALDVTATGSDHQWVLGSVPGGECGQKRCVHVFQTEDAGASWTDLGELPAYPVLQTEDSGSVDALRFAGDGGNGWAFRGNLISTHDGGQTWNEPDLPIRGKYNVLQLEAWGDDVLAAAETADGSVLLHSPADSDEWQVVPLAEQIGQPLDSPVITDMGVGEDAAMLAVQSGAQYVGQLLMSDDGGSTWSLVPTPDVCGTGEDISNVATAADSLWVVCRSLGPGNVHLTARVSTDQGATWTPAEGDFRSDALFAASDATHGVFVRPRGITPAKGSEVVQVTPDAGAGPEVLATIGIPDWVTSVGFTNPTTGYVVFDRSGVLRTSDAGQTWESYGVTSLN